MLLDHVAAVEVAHLPEHTDLSDPTLKTQNQKKRDDTSDSQEGVSGGVSYVRECVHIDVVVVQFLWEGAGPGLSKQHTQPPTQILRAVGLKGAVKT